MRPEVAIPVADQKDRGIWERDWGTSKCGLDVIRMHLAFFRVFESQPRTKSSFLEVERRATIKTSDCRSKNIGLLVEVRMSRYQGILEQSRSNRP